MQRGAAAPGRRGRGRGRGRPPTRREVPATTEEDVSLVYRRPRGAPRRERLDVDGDANSSPGQGLLDGAHLLQKSGTRAAGGRGTALAPPTPQMRRLESTLPAAVHFWHRCATDTNLESSLSNFHVLPIVDRDGKKVSILAADCGRMLCAHQALRDLRSLLVMRDDHPTMQRAATASSSGASTSTAAPLCSAAARDITEGPLSTGCQCFVRAHHFRAVVALATLAESAVQVGLPSLMVGDVTLNNTDGFRCRWTPSGEAAVDLLPSPCMLEALDERLSLMASLGQLRFAFTVLAPAVQRCTTTESITCLLFSHAQTLLQHRAEGGASAETSLKAFTPTADAVQQDAFVAFPPSNARHHLEQQLLDGLLSVANQACAVDVESWGGMGMLSPLRVADGVYVIHHAPRMDAMRALLREGELFGLPLFLRSIRRVSGVAYNSTNWASPMGITSAEGSGGRTSLLACGKKADHLFLTPASLDPAAFDPPEPMHALVIQEELMALEHRHCCYIMMVGEAHQILCLLKQSTEYWTSLWERRLKLERKLEGAVKAEIETGGAMNTANKALRDPLAHAVRQAVTKSKREPWLLEGGGTPGVQPSQCHVHWLCANRWSPGASYYGLVLSAVVPNGEGEMDFTQGTSEEVPVDADAPSDGAPLTQVSFYVAGVVELSRRTPQSAPPR